MDTHYNIIDVNGNKMYYFEEEEVMKKLIASAIAMNIILGVGVAMASPEIKVDGDIKAHYRWDTNQDGVNQDGGKFYLRLNVEANIAENTDAYARFASQHLTGDQIGADFSQDHYGKSGATALDRFGVKYKNAGWNYQLGRQGASIGGLATLYSTDPYYMGIDAGSIDGISVTGKTGVTDIQAIAGTEWNTGDGDNKIYGLHAAYSPAKDLKLGATLAKYDYADTSKDDTNHWAVDASYNHSKATYMGEYTKSNVDNDNTAYALGVSYAFDKKNSAYAFYSKVEAYGDMGGWTDFDPNGKGMYYGYDRQVSKDTTVSLFYKDMKDATNAKNYDSFRTTVTYKF